MECSVSPQVDSARSRASVFRANLPLSGAYLPLCRSTDDGTLEEVEDSDSGVDDDHV